MNLYSRLYTHRPNSNRSNLENFITEALADLLDREGGVLAQAILNQIAKVKPRENIQVKTQGHLGIFGIFDICISWKENGYSHSLIMENKAGSWVGTEGEEDQNNEEIQNTKNLKFKDQIDKYCKSQDEKNLQGIRRHYVVLITPHLFEGYSQEDRGDEVYLGNYTWRDVLTWINNDFALKSNDLSARVREFHDFMKEKKMAGFDGFNINECNSIKPYKNLLNNLGMLTDLINGSFKKDFEVIKKLASGVKAETEIKFLKDIKYGFFGLHLGEVNKTPADSCVWVFAGATSTDNPFLPDIILKDDLIPDVEVLFGIWFEKGNEGLRDDFIKKNRINDWKSKSGADFKFFEVHEGFVLTHRRAITYFLDEKNQWEAIENFLRNGISAFTEEGAPFIGWLSEFKKINLSHA